MECYLRGRTNVLEKKSGDVMKIGFIGAGRVGFTLGKLFAQGSMIVSGYYSLHYESSKEAACFTNSKAYTKLSELVMDSDVIFITVPDGQIKDVYEQISNMNLKNKQICHCSGVMTAGEAFSDIDSYEAFGYSIHPLSPISDKYESYQELTDVFFCIEGHQKHLCEWKERMESLGSHVRIIDSSVKKKYHAACAISSNLVCGLVQESIDLLCQCGFDEDDAMGALSPLIHSNLIHILKDGPIGALTGPLERGDLSTIQKHIECFDTALEKRLYCSVSEKLIELAEKKNHSYNYNEIKRILKDGE